MMEKQGNSDWSEREFAGSQFKGECLETRLRKLLQRVSKGTGEGIPMVFQDLPNIEAAYRFFANAQVSRNPVVAAGS